MKINLTSVVCTVLIALGLGAVSYAQYALYGALSPGSNVSPALSSIVDPVHGIYFGTNRVGITGHLESGDPTFPRVTGTNCGTIAAGSTDTVGGLTNGTATSGCAIVFGTPYNSAPFCQIQNLSTPANAGHTDTTTSMAIGTIVSGDVLRWQCFAQYGG